MDVDFQIFQMKLLMSLRQTTPLDENLRAVMASSLSKLKQHCGASLAVHVFMNVGVREMHVMVLGSSNFSQKVLDDELKRLYEGDHIGLIPRSKLPGYLRVDLPADSDITSLLNPLSDVRTEQVSPQMVDLFQQLTKLFQEEFAGISVAQGDSFTLIPLGTEQYRRLGGIILWAPSDTLAESFQDPDEQERLIVFRRGIEQLLIGLFTNFYRMVPHTYLPSYYRVEHKSVALICAEIRDFDRVSEILRHRQDFGRKRALNCLSKLVNRFSEKAGEVVEREPYRGRVDQIWGNGLLAVFGEYMDVQEPSPRVACMRAVAAAADLVEESIKVLDEWLWNDFEYEGFLTHNSEHISLRPVVAVDYGDVVFDYVGSSKNRVYMSIGNHVNFVKQLATMAGHSELKDNDYDLIVRRLFAMTNANTAISAAQFEEPPILLSQAAYTGSKHILRPLPHMPATSLHQARRIQLPGKQTLYSAYEIWPGNVDR